MKETASIIKTLIKEHGVVKIATTLAGGIAGGLAIAAILLNVIPDDHQIITENTIEKEN